MGTDASSRLSVATSRDQDRWPLVVWAALLIMLVCCVGLPAVRRTQEARVLESAREMVGSGFHGWMIPLLNGKVRLQKPPLTYWLAACGFECFGVSEWAGRLYAAVAAWLLVGVTYATARLLYADRRVALLAAAVFAGSYMFARFHTLAETDGLASLGVTTAIYCLLRSRAKRSGRREWIWLNLSSIAVAVAVMSKGPPGLYALLFMVGFAVLERDRGLIWRWIVSGAPLTFLLLAAPWWIFILHSPQASIVGHELKDVASGDDHGGTFLVYFPQFFLDTAPWCALLPVAIIETFISRRRERSSRIMLVWLLAIFLPLCVIGNKQPHYLLPMLPPLAILIGDASVRPSPAARWALIGTVIIACLLMIGFTAILFRVHPHFTAVDGMAAIAAALCAVLILTAWWRVGLSAAVTTLAGGSMYLLPLITLIWVPTLYQSDTRSLADQLRRRYGAGPFAFYGETVYLPLIFTMRQTTGELNTEDAVRSAVAAGPRLIVLSRVERQRSKSDPAGLEPALHYDGSIGVRDQRFDLYRSPIRSGNARQ